MLAAGERLPNVSLLVWPYRAIPALYEAGTATHASGQLATFG
jgi:hypothetical protein